MHKHGRFVALFLSALLLMFVGAQCAIATEFSTEIGVRINEKEQVAFTFTGGDGQPVRLNYLFVQRRLNRERNEKIPSWSIGAPSGPAIQVDEVIYGRPVKGWAGGKAKPLIAGGSYSVFVIGPEIEGHTQFVLENIDGKLTVRCPYFCHPEPAEPTSGYSKSAGIQQAKALLGKQRMVLLVPSVPPIEWQYNIKLEEYAKYGIEYCLTGDVYETRFEAYREGFNDMMGKAIEAKYGATFWKKIDQEIKAKILLEAPLYQR